MDTTALLLAGLAAGAILLIAVGVALSGGQGTVVSRLERYASATSAGTATEERRESPVIAGLTRVIERQDMATRLAVELARADMKLKPAEFLVMWAASPLVFVAVSFISGLIFPALRSPIALLAAALIGLYFPRLQLKRRQGKRLRAFNAQLPDTITLLANSLRAGSSFLQGMELVVRESAPPISEEFGRVIREMALGMTLQNALTNLVRRVASEDLELMVTAINIQSTVGGNLATVLDAIAFTIRERVRIQGEIKTLTAQQRYSGYVITALPVGLGAILMVISPQYFNKMFDRPPELFGLPAGVVFFIIGGFSMFLGYMLIRRIIDIKV
jgi:tight adherence protein B